MLTGRPCAIPSIRRASRALRLPSWCSANPSTESPSMTRTRTASGGETGRTDGGASARTTAPRIRAAGPREDSLTGAESRLSVVARAVPVDEHDGLVADHPGIVTRGKRGDVAGARVELAPVRHPDPQHARSVVLKVRRLAELGPRDRLDVQRPPPSGVEGRPPARAPADVDEIDAALLENPLLVGASQGLVFRRCCGWHGMPPVKSCRAVSGASRRMLRTADCRLHAVHIDDRPRSAPRRPPVRRKRLPSAPPRVLRRLHDGGRRNAVPPRARTPPTAPGRWAW